MDYYLLKNIRKLGIEGTEELSDELKLAIANNLNIHYSHKRFKIKTIGLLVEDLKNKIEVPIFLEVAQN